MRLKEIEKRLAAIKNELTTRAAELKEEEITALDCRIYLDIWLNGEKQHWS